MITKRTIDTLSRRLSSADAESASRLGSLYDAAAMRTQDGQRQTILLLLSDACLGKAAYLHTQANRPWDSRHLSDLAEHSASCLAGALRRVDPAAQIQVTS